MALIHVDTDIGGDIDDLCAIAMLLGWPGVEISAITTVVEDGGRRAGYVRRLLEVAGRTDVPIAAGVDVASGAYPYAPAHHRAGPYWGEAPAPLPGAPEAALDLIEDSLAGGAILLAIGPYSNVAALERRRPGALDGAQVVLMGGRIFPPREGFPPWTYETDYNVQMDVSAAEAVMAACTPLIVPIEVTVETAVREAHLPPLEAAGPLGALVARQARASGEEERPIRRLAQRYSALPPDLLNFLHDPLAAAIAAGWREGIVIERRRLGWRRHGALLEGVPDDAGHEADLVTRIDGEAFGAQWLEAVIRASA